jgi:putative tryptophan/tyrosine transport system substrate-binding protein
VRAADAGDRLPQRDLFHRGRTVCGRGSPGTREAGYVEGQNLAIEYRWAEGRHDRLPALAADLVSRKVDVILASGGDLSATAAKNVTSTISIVFAVAGDPVEEGLVTTLARPGGNLTGVSTVAVELNPSASNCFPSCFPKPV